MESKKPNRIAFNIPIEPCKRSMKWTKSHHLVPRMPLDRSKGSIDGSDQVREFITRRNITRQYRMSLSFDDIIRRMIIIISLLLQYYLIKSTSETQALGAFGQRLDSKERSVMVTSDAKLRMIEDNDDDKSDIVKNQYNYDEIEMRPISMTRNRTNERSNSIDNSLGFISSNQAEGAKIGNKLNVNENGNDPLASQNTSSNRLNLVSIWPQASVPISVRHSMLNVSSTTSNIYDTYSHSPIKQLPDYETPIVTPLSRFSEAMSLLDETGKDSRILNEEESVDGLKSDQNSLLLSSGTSLSTSSSSRSSKGREKRHVIDEKLNDWPTENPRLRSKGYENVARGTLIEPDELYLFLGPMIESSANKFYESFLRYSIANHLENEAKEGLEEEDKNMEEQGNSNQEQAQFDFGYSSSSSPFESKANEKFSKLDKRQNRRARKEASKWQSDTVGGVNGQNDDVGESMTRMKESGNIDEQEQASKSNSNSKSNNEEEDNNSNSNSNNNNNMRENRDKNKLQTIYFAGFFPTWPSEDENEFESRENFGLGSERKELDEDSRMALNGPSATNYYYNKQVKPKGSHYMESKSYQHQLKQQHREEKGSNSLARQQQQQHEQQQQQQKQRRRKQQQQRHRQGSEGTDLSSLNDTAEASRTRATTKMTNLISKYNSAANFNKIIKNNGNNIDSDNTHSLSLATGSNIPGHNNYSLLGKIILPAVRLALDHINKNSSILSSYRLEIVPSNTQCNATVSLKKFFDLMYEKPKKMLLYGDACRNSTDPIAKASYFFDLIQISYADTDPIYTIENYPNFFRVIPSENALSSARIPFIRHFNWTRVGTIYQNLPRYSLPHSKLLTDLERYKIVIKQSVSLPGSIESLHYRDLGDELRKLKDKDVRIILGNFDEEWALHLFCEAFKEKMIGRKYLWLLTGINEDRLWRLYDRMASAGGLECTRQELLTAMDGYIITDITPVTRSQNPTISGLMANEFSEEYRRRIKETDSYVIDNKFYGYVYDGIWAIALALDRVDKQLRLLQAMKKDRPSEVRLNPDLNDLYTLNDFDYSKPIWAKLIRNALNKTRFHGVTGTVSFDKNERPGLITFSQFQPFRDPRNEVVIASYDALNDHLDLQIGFPISWRGPSPPIDYTIQRLTPFRINRTLFVIISIFAVFGIILAFVFLTINIKFRNQRYIKMSSPYLNNLIIIGCILTYTSVIILGLDSGLTSEYNFPYICNARAWVLMAGFTLAFGSMFSKTFRVHSIFTNIKLHKKVIKDYKLFMVVFILLTFDVCILIVWQYFDPFYRETNNGTSIQDSENEDVIIVPEMEHCQSQRMTIFLSVIYIYKGLLMAFGCFLAWETRHVSIPALNDSKYIGLSVYNVVIMCVIGAGLSFALRDQQDASFVIISIFIIFCSTTTLCLVFVPKVRMLIELRQNPKAADQRVRATLKTFAKNYRDGGALGTIPTNCRDIHGNIIHARAISVDLNEKIRLLMDDNTKQRGVLRDKTFELEALTYKYRKMMNMIQSGQYLQALNTTAGATNKLLNQQNVGIASKLPLIPAPTVISLPSIQAHAHLNSPLGAPISPALDQNNSGSMSAVNFRQPDIASHRQSPSPTRITTALLNQVTMTTSSGNTTTDLTIDTTNTSSTKMTSSFYTNSQSYNDSSKSSCSIKSPFMASGKACCVELQLDKEANRTKMNTNQIFGSSGPRPLKSTEDSLILRAQVRRYVPGEKPLNSSRSRGMGMIGRKQRGIMAQACSRSSCPNINESQDDIHVSSDRKLPWANKSKKSSASMSMDINKTGSGSISKIPRTLSMIEYLGESRLSLQRTRIQNRCCCHRGSTYSCCYTSNGESSNGVSPSGYSKDMDESSSEKLFHCDNGDSGSQLTCSSCCQSYDSHTFDDRYEENGDDHTASGGSMQSLGRSSCDSRSSVASGYSARKQHHLHHHQHRTDIQENLGLSTMSKSSSTSRSSSSSVSNLPSNSSVIIDHSNETRILVQGDPQTNTCRHQVRFAARPSAESSRAPMPHSSAILRQSVRYSDSEEATLVESTSKDQTSDFPPPPPLSPPTTPTSSSRISDRHIDGATTSLGPLKRCPLHTRPEGSASSHKQQQQQQATDEDEIGLMINDDEDDAQDETNRDMVIKCDIIESL